MDQNKRLITAALLACAITKVAAARAQQAPPAAGGPAPSATPVEPGAPSGEASAPSREAPSATVAPPPLRWRGSTFEWYQQASAQYFGAGDTSVAEENQSYHMLFRFSPSYLLVDAPNDKLAVSATLWGESELTRGNVTPGTRPFELRDLTLSLKYARTVLRDPPEDEAIPEQYLRLGVGAGIAFPTSRVSMLARRDLTVNVGPNVRKQIKLLGASSPLLPNASVALSLTYSHSFMGSSAPVEPDLHRRRQDARGDPIDSDALSRFTMTADSLIVGANAALPIYKGLSLVAGYRHWMRWSPRVSQAVPGRCDLPLDTGCAPADSADIQSTFFTDTLFEVALTQSFSGVIEGSFGFMSWANVSGESSRGRSVYTPVTAFYIDLTANLDVIYSRVTDRDKRPPAMGRASSWF